jgi:hypothetical protein
VNLEAVVAEKCMLTFVSQQGLRSSRVATPSSERNCSEQSCLDWLVAFVKSDAPNVCISSSLPSDGYYG